MGALAAHTWIDRPGRTVAALMLAVFVLGPFTWMAIVSISPERDLFVNGMRYLPSQLTAANYAQVIGTLNFGRAAGNSMAVAVSTTIVAICVAVPAGYAFARYRFFGRTLLIVSLLLIYMLPGIVLVVPLLVLFRTLGLLNTLHGLVLAESTQAIPFAVWLLTNYFASLPRELEEAAQIDGCTRVGALLRVALPLAVPGLIGAGLFVFIASWNNFLFAFMLTSGEDVRTLPVVLRLFGQGEAGLDWGVQMAGSVLAAMPVALGFLFFQRFLVRGLTAGSMKG